MTAESCTTTQQFVVKGKPGTEIYTADHRLLATTKRNGEADIIVPSDGHFAFLCAKSKKNNDMLVPFAVNFEQHRYKAADITGKLGTKLLIGGTATTLAGAFVALLGPQAVGLPILITGFAAGVVCIPFMIGKDRKRQTSYNQEFRYVPEQEITDILFTQPVYDEPVKPEHIAIMEGK